MERFEFLKHFKVNRGGGVEEKYFGDRWWLWFVSGGVSGWWWNDGSDNFSITFNF